MPRSPNVVPRLVAVAFVVGFLPQFGVVTRQRGGVVTTQVSRAARLDAQVLRQEEASGASPGRGRLSSRRLLHRHRRDTPGATRGSRVVPGLP